MNMLLLGAIAMACFITGLFFIRFWKITRDKFFLFFAITFFIEAAERVMLGTITHSDEQEPLFYLPRLLAFLMILYAILDKNRLLKRKA